MYAVNPTLTWELTKLKARKHYIAATLLVTGGLLLMKQLYNAYMLMKLVKR
jgi:hypothetical protein